MNKKEKVRILARAAQPVDNLMIVAAQVGDIIVCSKNGNADLTIEQLAGFIRYQALNFNGQWDAEMLAEAFSFLKRVIVLG